MARYMSRGIKKKGNNQVARREKGTHILFNLELEIEMHKQLKSTANKSVSVCFILRIIFLCLRHKLAK
jgi:hypothetical protein